MNLGPILKTQPHPCGYLPSELATLEQAYAADLSSAEYRALLDARWRRFGRGLFRPVCASCSKCIPIRIPVDTFQPNRSQKRNARSNRHRLQLKIETVSSDPAQLRTVTTLHFLFHGMQQEQKQWREVDPWDSAGFVHEMTDQPFAVELWSYWYEDQVVAAGYVDPLPDGLSAIYFVHHPKVRDFAPGIWNVLCMLEGARLRGLSYLYLGYWVKGSDSMAYKAGFLPAEILSPEGVWVPHPANIPI